MVVCPSLSPFIMVKIFTSGGRHLSHIQPFSLIPYLHRARTFLFLNLHYSVEWKHFPSHRIIKFAEWGHFCCFALNIVWEGFLFFQLEKIITLNSISVYGANFFAFEFVYEHYLRRSIAKLYRNENG